MPDERTPSQIRGAMVTDPKNSASYLSVLILKNDNINVKLEVEQFHVKYNKSIQFIEENPLQKMILKCTNFKRRFPFFR